MVFPLKEILWCSVSVQFFHWSQTEDRQPCKETSNKSGGYVFSLKVISSCVNESAHGWLSKWLILDVSGSGDVWIRCTALWRGLRREDRRKSEKPRIRNQTSYLGSQLWPHKKAVEGTLLNSAQVFPLKSFNGTFKEQGLSHLVLDFILAMSSQNSLKQEEDRKTI